ncbi:MAG: site-2 protease family protein, partial [Candidatus Omnitrophica bacterium]|nr:site-2 protease family protein [Candidatus Omnitrophota bacterium]
MEHLLANLKVSGVFAGVLSVLILVHEWGHFITARRLGVKVERFALGFGPKLFSWKRAETEFMLCLIPLGGYVKMAGDERSECRGLPGEFYSQSPAR